MTSFTVTVGSDSDNVVEVVSNPTVYSVTVQQAPTSVTVNQIGGENLDIKENIISGPIGPQGPAGATGPQGAIGNTGPGVAAGGNANQILSKVSSADYDTQWIDYIVVDFSPAFNQANLALTTAQSSFDVTNTKVTINSSASLANLSVSNHIDLTPKANETFKEGRLYYSSEEKTWIGYGDYSDFEQTLGQREWVRCRNSTANTIPKGSAVYVTGVHIPGNPIHGHHPTIELADASDITKKDVLGITGHDIPAGQHGYVVVRGYIEGLDTSALTEASRVHLGYNGGIVNDAPEYPNWPMDVGICLTSNTTNGTLYVTLSDHSMERLRVQNSGRIGGDFTVEGDFTVFGDQNILKTNSLQVGTQFIYMGAGDSIANANINFTGVGLNDISFKGHYENAGNTTYYVTISDTNPDKFSWGYTSDFSNLVQANVVMLYQTSQALSNGISVYFSANTGHTKGDKWNATAFGTSTDFGFVGNHIDGPNGYTHAGLFRDATDGVYKFFNSYDSEISGNIDIANSTFGLGNLQVFRVVASQVYEGSTRLGDVSTTATSALTTASAAFNNANNKLDLAGGNVTGNLSVNTSVVSNNVVANTITGRAVQGSFTATTRVINSSNTVLITDQNIFANGTIVLTLPSAIGVIGKEYMIKNMGTGEITILPILNQTIDGQSNLILGEQYSAVGLVSNGSSWFIC